MLDLSVSLRDIRIHEEAMRTAESANDRWRAYELLLRVLADMTTQLATMKDGLLSAALDEAYRELNKTEMKER